MSNFIKTIDTKVCNGGEGGIRTHVPVTRQDAFEAPPLRPLRYLSVWLRGGTEPMRYTAVLGP